MWYVLAIEYILIGAVAGTVAGLLGVGGAILVVPALVWVFSTQIDIPQLALMHYVVGTSLAATIATTLFSLRAQYHRGLLSWSLFLKLFPGVAIGVILGTILASFLQSHILRTLFGVFMILVSAQTLFRFRESKEPSLPGKLNRWIASLFIGLFSGLLGISGGALTIPYLTYFKIHIRQAMAISTACGVVIAITGTISFIISGLYNTHVPVPWSSGYVYWPAALGIAFGSPLFATLGASWSHNLPVRHLRHIFAAFLLLVGLNMLLG